MNLKKFHLRNFLDSGLFLHDASKLIYNKAETPYMYVYTYVNSLTECIKFESNKLFITDGFI